MSDNIVDTELYTRAASEPPHSELEAADPTQEEGQQAIFANLIQPGSGVIPVSRSQAVQPTWAPMEQAPEQERQRLYSKARSSGMTLSSEYEKVVGRRLTSDEERALWDNKGDEDLVAMGR